MLPKKPKKKPQKNCIIFVQYMQVPSEKWSRLKGNPLKLYSFTLM